MSAPKDESYVRRGWLFVLVFAAIGAALFVFWKIKTSSAENSTARNSLSEVGDAYKEGPVSGQQDNSTDINSEASVRSDSSNASAVVDQSGGAVYQAEASESPTTQNLARNVTPRFSPKSWVTENDYPAEAQRNGIQGTTSFELTVDREGAVDRCTVLASSGSGLLDSETCKLVARRARFNPALDASGQAIEGSYKSRISWGIAHRSDNQ